MVNMSTYYKILKRSHFQGNESIEQLRITVPLMCWVECYAFPSPILNPSSLVFDCNRDMHVMANATTTPTTYSTLATYSAMPCLLSKSRQIPHHLFVEICTVFAFFVSVRPVSENSRDWSKKCNNNVILEQK